jgi:hypothetical protein
MSPARQPATSATLPGSTDAISPPCGASDVAPRGRYRLHRHAELRAHHASIAKDAQHHVDDDVGGDREAEVHRLPKAARIDADDATGEIDERPARVARIDRRVGLDPRVVEAGLLTALELEDPEIAIEARDDAERERARQAERRAHRHHEVADLQRVLRRERRVRDFVDTEFREVELHDREICRRIRANARGAATALVRERADQPLRGAGHVKVRDDDAVLADDDAAAVQRGLDGAAAACDVDDRLDVHERREHRVARAAQLFVHGRRGRRVGDELVLGGGRGGLGGQRVLRGKERRDQRQRCEGRSAKTHRFLRGADRERNVREASLHRQTRGRTEARTVATLRPARRSRLRPLVPVVRRGRRPCSPHRQRKPTPRAPRRS